MTKKHFETPHILHDLPLDQHDKAHFHFDEFAVTLARLIADKTTRTPLTIGVSGAWGSGKTTLLRRVQQQLDQTLVMLDQTKPALMEFVNEDEVPQQKFRVCRTAWFNAWKYADENELLVALVRVLVQEMYKDDFISKGAAAIFDPFRDRRDVIDTVLGWFSVKTPFGDITLNTGEAKETLISKKTAMVDLFDQAFNRLMAAWVHRKLDVEKIDPEKGVLVVFIDDLDRCLPGKTVQVLEAVKLFLDKPGCIFVLGAETGIVQRAIAKHYEDAGVTGESAKDYLEKVIQLRFELPPIVSDTLKDFLTDEGVDAELQKHWQVLVTGAELNPRKVKTFVNDLNLQWAMLQNTGQAPGVVRDDFTRWQVLWRTAPDNFKQRVSDIDDLELRLKFIQDALKWGCGKGDEILNKTFQEYEASQRLRRVLRVVEDFSRAFDAASLDAFVHLTAPPQKLEPVVQARPDYAEIAGTNEQVDAERLAQNNNNLLLDELRREVRKVRLAGSDLIEVGSLQFVRIPAGKFILGSKEDNPLAVDGEKPQQTLELPDYWMAKYPLTNQRYADFKGKGEKLVPSWEKRKDHPVVNISWTEAIQYCKWFNETYQSELRRLGLTVQLPTETQWEKAARGEYGNEWPWGNEFDGNKCNSVEGKKPKGDTTPVDAYPQGESPYGVADMVGNVWEWTHTLTKAYPYHLEDGREGETDPGSRVLRGGSFDYDRWVARCAYRDRSLRPDNRGNAIGFRVCASPIS